MKTKLVVEVGDYERYVIARYYSVAARTARDRQRQRATRAQVRQFTQAALRAAVRDQVELLRSRARSTAQRLAIGRPVAHESLPLPPERQQSLVW